MNNTIELLKKKIFLQQPSVLKIEYSEFKKSYEQYKKILDEDCLVMISENIAIVCFDKYSYIKLHIWNGSDFIREDFDFMKKAQVIGAGKEDRQSFGRMLLTDIRRLLIPICLAYLCLSIFYLSAESDMQKLNDFNEILITVCSIFIATVFVFIGLFYGDKDRAVILYRKGKCDVEYYTDRYIILISFISLILLIISFCICSIENLRFNSEKLNVILSKIHGITEYDAALLMTYLAVAFMIICFDSLINYYLRTCRNEFFVEAVNLEMEDRKNKSTGERQKNNISK